MKPDRDPNKLLVRQWLQENLEDGSWEEVKWFPARTVPGLRDLNLLHIVEAMEADQQSFERGALNEDNSSEFQEFYKNVRDSEPRTFCALKFRTTTLNGQAKALRNQTFEIVKGKAKSVKGNDIKELTSPLMKNGHLASHDGWRYFEDHEFEPFPNEPIEGLEKRFQAAAVWKAPVKEIPVVLVEPQPEKISNVEAPKKNPSLDSVVPEIPRRIREYFDRELKVKSAEAAILEKRIATFEARLRTAKTSQVSVIEGRILQTKDELAEVRRKRFTAPLSDQPLVGDFGGLSGAEVIAVVDEETVLARWFPNGKGRLPRLEVVICPIERRKFKVGDSAVKADELYSVTATKDEPSETINKLAADGKKPEFVVEAADTDEIKKWRPEYDKELRNKK